MKVKVHTSFIGKTGYNAHSRDFFTALSKIVKLKIRNFTVGDHWSGLCNDPHEGETNLTDYQKYLLGEQTVINSEGELYDVEIYDGMSDIENYDIDLVLNETNHYYYYDLSKFKGKFKIAYNVWESTKQPQEYFNAILGFDQFWVPSEWQKQVTIEQGYPADKIYVVPEAVDSKIYFPDKNHIKLDEYNDNRFKFLVFGRWDHRKSTGELIRTFLETFDKSEPIDLIMSIDNPYSIDGMKSTQERLDKFGFNDERIKILEFPSKDDYVNYLKSGHVFLSCARSEGWNLPLIEALACGTPSIYSDWGAQLQFAGGKGHPVKILGESPVDDSKTYGLGKPKNHESDAIFSEVSVLGNFCEPDFDDLSKVMRDVYTNYWIYKNKALLDSKLIIDEFSWENSAEIAYNILEDIYKNKLRITEDVENSEEIIEEITEDVENSEEIIEEVDIHKPKISVVTSFYNVENYVYETVESVLKQTFGDFEFIITDDFSTDSTKEHLLKCIKNDRRIKYVEQSEKQEIYWNPHKYANGEIVVILDSDDVLVPKALDVLINMFDKNADVVLIDSNSIHYNNNIESDSFKSPRYCKKPNYFSNYLSYHKYYINHDNFRYGNTWGGLRSFRNILPKEYDFRENFDLKLGKHEDLLRIFKFEEIGKILHIGRVLNNVRDRENSNSKKTTDLEFDKIWYGVNKRRQKINLDEPTISKKYDSIWETIYSMGYSNIHEIVEKTKISIMNSDYSDNEKLLIREVYSDHDIIFDKINSDVEYYFINFSTYNYIKNTLNEILYTKHNSKINISLQSKIRESEPDLIIKDGQFNGTIKKYLEPITQFKWYIYDNTYFFLTFNMEYNIMEDNDIKSFAFLTGGDEGYLPIVETCVKSLREHSNIPVIVYGFNCDVPFDYPNMEKRRLDINRPRKNLDKDTRPYYYKIDASLDCIKNDNTKVYMWLDGDCVVTNNINSIVKYYTNLDRYPLCMRYKHTDLIHRGTTSIGYNEKGHGEELGELFGEKNNNDFIVATGLYMFDFRSEWFFDDILFHHEKLLENVSAVNCVDDMALAEERLFNVLFWKNNFKRCLPITWVSNTYFLYEDGNNEFIPKIQDYIKSGFDVMFDFDGTDPLKNNLEEQSKILFYHGQRNILKAEKMLNNLKQDKLMIVAHPDDETIFGGGMLLNEDGWKVVVVTSGDGDNNDPKIRETEFKSIMNYLNIDYELLGFKDDMNNVLYDEFEVESKLRKIIEDKKWRKIITHNKEGEYNHIIHKSIHQIVKNINPDNLYFFKKSNDKLNPTLLNQKNNLLSFYESQNTNLPGFNDYLIYEGTTDESKPVPVEYDIITPEPIIIFNFDNVSAFVEIKNIGGTEEYEVEFIDGDTNINVYSVSLNNNQWARTSKMESQLNLIIKISNKNVEIFKHVFNLNGKKIKFIFNDISNDKLRTQLDVINLLIDKYKIDVFVVTEHEELPQEYNRIQFNQYPIVVDYYATYNLNEDDNLNVIFSKLLN